MRLKLWLVLPCVVLYAVLCGWAISDGHPAIGIAGLVALIVIPNVLGLAIKARRSR